MCVLLDVAQSSSKWQEARAKPASAAVDCGRADQLLHNKPRLHVSIGLRNLCIGPLSLKQLDPLQRWRASG